MRRKIEFQEFIEALVEANEKLKAASALDDTVQKQEQRAAALSAQIEKLTADSEHLSHAIRDHKKSVDEHVAREKANADQTVAAYKAAKEAEMTHLNKLVADAKRVTDAKIEQCKADEQAALAALASAKKELEAITEALERSRAEASKLARFANVARA